MTTRAQTQTDRVAAFKHLLEVVLGFIPNSPVHQSMENLQYDGIDDIETMNEKEVMALQYKNDYNDPTEQYKDVPMKGKKKLLHSLWWFDAEVAKRSNRIITNQDWLALTPSGFDMFVAQNASLARKTTAPRTVTTSSAGQGITGQSVERFQSGHKRDISKYIKFAGNRKDWHKVNRQWRSQASVDQVGRTIDSTTVIPVQGTEDRQLYDEQNAYLFNVLTQSVTGGQALIIVREQEKNNRDGRGAYLAMVAFYDRNANVAAIRVECAQKLATMKLTRSTPGGPIKFFQTFQNIYLDWNKRSTTLYQTKKRSVRC